MKVTIRIVCFLVVLITSNRAWSEEAKLGYQPVDGGYQIVDSQAFFNRALYGSHANDDSSDRFFTLAGDQPLIMGAVTDWRKRADCLHAKSGTFMMGVALTPGVRECFKGDFDVADRYSQWFHKSLGTVATYRNGWMEYDIDPLFYGMPHVKAHVEVLPLMPEDGFLIHLKVNTDQRVILCMGFGGITDYLGRFDSTFVPSRYFRPEDCNNNDVICKTGKAEVRDKTGKLSTRSMWIGTSFPADFSVADANQALLYPSVFLASKCDSSKTPMVRISCVIEQGKTLDGYVVIMRNQSEAALDKWLTRKQPANDIKGQIRQIQTAMGIKTPDSMLDLTIPPSVLGMDSCWHKNVFYHGTYVWASPYLGFRCWYGPTVLGWHDRVETCFRTHAEGKVVKSDSELFLPSLLGTKNNYYNMQEVATDMLLHSIEWNGNIASAKDTFETVSGILNWEKNNLDGNNDWLYTNKLNFWASDAQWWSPDAGCTIATSYNYSANKRMAAIAAKIGKSSEPFEMRAKCIKANFMQKLWLPDKGVAAEYVDCTGNELVHPSPQLPTIYHAIESGIVDQFQAYQMLRFTETDIRNEYSLNGGRMVWLSNWYPQMWTSCGLYPAENIHLAWAYYKNGQSNKAMEILKGIVGMFFLGGNPGSVGYMQNSNGHSEGFGDFADLNSMYLRCIAEGLFGIKFNLLEGTIEVAPNFPADWDHAHLKLKDISLEYSRNGSQENLSISCTNPGRRILKLPMRSADSVAVFLNNKSSAYSIEQLINRSNIFVETSESGDLNLTVIHGSSPLPTINCTGEVFTGEHITISISSGQIIEIKDPSGCVIDIVKSNSTLTGTATNKTGNHTIFVRVKKDQWEGWLAADFKIIEPQQLAGEKTHGEFEPVDISTCYNFELKDVNHAFWAVTHAGRRDNKGVVIDDTALRQCGGKYRTPSGILFCTPQSGKNAACASVSYNGKYPRDLSIPLLGKGEEVAILLIGLTNQMQSRVENASLAVNYTDGSTKKISLVNPDNFDDWAVAAVQRENETVYFSNYNHAIVQKIPLDHEKELASLSVSAIANEVVVGILGVSIARNSQAGMTKKSNEQTSPAKQDLNVLSCDSGHLLRKYLLDEAKKSFSERRKNTADYLKNADSVRQRQKRLKEAYKKLMGDFPERNSLNARTTGTIDCNGYKIEKVVFESHPHHYVTGNLYIPSGADKKPCPGILIVSGHWREAKGWHENQKMGILCALNGLVALAIDPISQGERFQLYDPNRQPAKENGELLVVKTFEHTLLDTGARLVGLSTPALEAWDNMRGIDYLLSRPEVDRNKKVGCTGCSGGGTQTTFLMALDDRIGPAAPSCFLTTSEWVFENEQQMNDGCQHLAGEGANGIERTDYIIMRAPNPTLVLTAEDDFFDIKNTRELVDEAKKSYAMLGAADRLDMFVAPGGHGFSKHHREKAVQWFRRWLLDDARTICEPNVTVQTQQDTNVTKTGQTISEWPDALSSFDIVRNYGYSLAEDRKHFWKKYSEQECLAKVKELLGIAAGTQEVTLKHTGKISYPDYSIEKLVIKGDDGFPIPAILYLPKKIKAPMPVSIYVDGKGKQLLAEEFILKKLNSGKAILSIDVRGVGETVDTIAYRYPNHMHSDEFVDTMLAMHISHPLLGQRVQDVLTVLDCLPQVQDVRSNSVELIGVGRCGPIALHAAALDKRIAHVVVQDSITTWLSILDEPVAWGRISCVVPGALKYYDLPNLVNVISKKKVEIINPVTASGKPAARH